MGGTQSNNNNNDNYYYYEEEDVFVNENMRNIQDNLAWQPKKEMPLRSSEMNARAKERRQEYERKKRNRSARLNNISRQWAASHMRNSEHARGRDGMVMMTTTTTTTIQDDTDDDYQNRWTCCGLFP